MSLRHGDKSFHCPLHAVGIISTLVGSAIILVVFVACGGRRYELNLNEAADAAFHRGGNSIGGSGDRRILVGYGYAVGGNLRLAQSELPSQRPPLPFRIVQASPLYTGGAQMTNILQGLFEPHSNLCRTVNIGASYDDPCPSNVVIKMRMFEDADAWAARNGAVDGVFIISTNREPQTVDAELCTRSNVLCFDYEDFKYANDEEMRHAVRTVANGIRWRFPYFADFDFDVDTAFSKLKRMDMLTGRI